MSEEAHEGLVLFGSLKATQPVDVDKFPGLYELVVEHDSPSGRQKQITKVTYSLETRDGTLTRVGELHEDGKLAGQIGRRVAVSCFVAKGYLRAVDCWFPAAVRAAKSA